MKESRIGQIMLGVGCVLLAVLLLALSGRVFLSNLEAVDVIDLRKRTATLLFVVLPLVSLFLVTVAWSLLRKQKSLITAVLIVTTSLFASKPSIATERPFAQPDNGSNVTLIEGVFGFVIVVFVGHALIRIVLNWSDNLPPVNPPPKPPKVLTNAPPRITNSAPRRIMGTLTNSTARNISHWATNSEWDDPTGGRFTVFGTAQIQCGTNHSFSGNTELFTLYVWRSHNWQETVLYDDAMKPIETNLSPRNVESVLDTGLPVRVKQFCRTVN